MCQVGADCSTVWGDPAGTPASVPTCRPRPLGHGPLRVPMAEGAPQLPLLPPSQTCRGPAGAGSILNLSSSRSKYPGRADRLTVQLRAGAGLGGTLLTRL